MLARRTAQGPVTDLGAPLDKALEQLYDGEKFIEELNCEDPDQGIPPFRNLPGSGLEGAVDVRSEKGEGRIREIEPPSRRPPPSGFGRKRPKKSQCFTKFERLSPGEDQVCCSLLPAHEFSFL